MNSEERENTGEETSEAPPEPESIQTIRKILAEITADVDRGNIQELSCYAATTDGDYATWQSKHNGRHEDAGRILKLALIRLGFVQKEDVDRIVDGL